MRHVVAAIDDRPHHSGGGCTLSKQTPRPAAVASLMGQEETCGPFRHARNWCRIPENIQAARGEQMRTSMSMVLLFVAVLIDGVSNFAAAQQNTAPVYVHWDVLSKHLVVVLILGAIGAIGGYLSARQKELAGAIPFHMLQGAAGAVIIVTLAPVDQNTVDNLFIADNTPFIKFVALALIGGYAGGSLLESSVGQLAKGISELKENQTELKKNQNKLAEETKKDSIRFAQQYRFFGACS
jgi:hypothetical protein